MPLVFLIADLSCGGDRVAYFSSGARCGGDGGAPSSFAFLKKVFLWVFICFFGILFLLYSIDFLRLFEILLVLFGFLSVFMGFYRFRFFFKN